MKRFSYLLPLMLLLLFACRKDRRTPLFDMPYPNFRFTINAGENPFLPGSYAIRGVSTSIKAILGQHSSDTSAIGEINALSASLRNLDGQPYSFLDAISVRICKDGTDNCTPADEVFYLDQLQLYPPGDRIELLPGLRNVRRDLIREQFRLEVVIFFAFSPPVNYPTQLDMVFRAFR